jgi:hypothetical protein
MEYLRGGSLTGEVQHGSLAAGALSERLLGGEAGDFGMIVGLAQVGKDEDLGRAIKVRGEKIRRREVREVAVAAHDPLLDVPGVRPDLEHVQIMIGFED